MLLIAWPCSDFVNEIGSANDSGCPPWSLLEPLQRTVNISSQFILTCMVQHVAGTKGAIVILFNHVLIHFHFRSPFSFFVPFFHLDVHITYTCTKLKIVSEVFFSTCVLNSIYMYFVFISVDGEITWISPQFDKHKSLKNNQIVK